MKNKFVEELKKKWYLSFCKTILVVVLCCVAIVSLSVHFLGYEIFKIQNTTQLYQYLYELGQNLGVKYIFSSVLLAINIVLWVATICQKRITLELCVISYILAYSCQYTNNQMLANLFTFFLVIYSSKLPLKRTIARFINQLILTSGYLILSSFYKLGFFNLKQELTLPEMVLYSVDYIILLIALFFDKGGANYGEQKERQTTHMDILYPFSKPYRKVSGGYEKTYQFIQLNPADKALLFLVLLLQLGLVCSTVIYLGKFQIFIIVYLGGFLPQKLVSGFNYHAKTVIGCTIQSIVAFTSAIMVVPELGVSAFLPVISGSMVVYAILYLQYRNSKKESQKMCDKENLKDKIEDLKEIFDPEAGAGDIPKETLETILEKKKEGLG